MNAVTKQALTFIINVYLEQLEAGECGDAVLITDAKSIIDQGLKQGMVREYNGLYFVNE